MLVRCVTQMVRLRLYDAQPAVSSYALVNELCSIVGR